MENITIFREKYKYKIIKKNQIIIYMSKKFLVKYYEWENDGQALFQDSYFYQQEIYQKFTISDVKEFVKGKRYEIHEPICTCFLSIWKDADKEKNQIGNCLEYNDSTLLNNTIFNESTRNMFVQNWERNVLVEDLIY